MSIILNHGIMFLKLEKVLEAKTEMPFIHLGSLPRALEVEDVSGLTRFSEVQSVRQPPTVKVWIHEDDKTKLLLKLCKRDCIRIY